MPIRVIAIAELVVAIALTVWRPFAGEIEGPDPMGVLLFCGVALLNAGAILWCTRRKPPRVAVLGLALAALGGASLLLLAGSGLWMPRLFPWDGSFSGLFEVIGLTVIALELVAWSAGISLVLGWGLVLIHRWWAQRLPA